MKKYTILVTGALLIIGSIVTIFLSLPDGENYFGAKQIACLITLILGAYIVVRSIEKIINN
jgi:hypothetical protein